jgi:sugar phosphate isomerase/epimerase
MLSARRTFLTISALSLVARRTFEAEPPHLRFPTTPKDRLAVASYSFRNTIDTPRNRTRRPDGSLISLRDFPARIVQRFGIHNVELLGQHFPSTDSAYLDDLRGATEAAGSRIVNIPTSVGASVYDPDPAARATAIADAKKWIDVAAAINCPSVRVHIQKAGTAPPDVDLSAKSLRLISEYGSAKNVIVNLENDDLFSEDAVFIEKVIDRVASPWLRALPDFGNSMLKGDEQFNYTAVTQLFRRAYNISHAKDSEVSNGRVVRVDLARTFAIAEKSGYKGWFSIEWEGAGDDPWIETGKLIDQSLRYLS